MQVFQTAGVPPNLGKISLPNIGCRLNISVALVNSVAAKSRMSENLRSCKESDGVFIIIIGCKSMLFRVRYDKAFLMVFGCWSLKWRWFAGPMYALINSANIRPFANQISATIDMSIPKFEVWIGIYTSRGHICGFLTRSFVRERRYLHGCR
jgi:hypothetical protein